MKKRTNNSTNNDENTSVNNATIVSLNCTLQRIERAMVSIISQASDDSEDSTSN